LVKDGLLEIKAKLFPVIGGSVVTNDEYHLTDAGREFVGNLRGNEPLADVIAWAEDYWPNGRHIYYEGGEPGGGQRWAHDDRGDPSGGQLVTDTALRRRRCSVMQPCGSRVEEGTRRCKHR
jgi:hypothetical protein